MIWIFMNIFFFYIYILDGFGLVILLLVRIVSNDFVLLYRYIIREIITSELIIVI